MILYVQRDTLLLANDFENFKNMSLKISEPDPAKPFSAPGWAGQADFKKTKVKFDLLSAINMLLMVEKILVEEYITLFYGYEKANKK